MSDIEKRIKHMDEEFQRRQKTLLDFMMKEFEAQEKRLFELEARFNIEFGKTAYNSGAIKGQGDTLEKRIERIEEQLKNKPRKSYKKLTPAERENKEMEAYLKKHTSLRARKK